MCGLEFEVRFGNLWAWLAQPKAQLPKQPLTLPGFQFHSVVLAQISRERGAVPHWGRQSLLRRTGTQGRFDLSPRVIVRPAGTPGALPCGQTGQPAGLETLNPVYDAARRIAQQISHLRTGHSLSDEQNAMEAMIVSRSIVAPDFVLESPDRVFGVRYCQCFHQTQTKPTRQHRQLFMTLCLVGL